MPSEDLASRLRQRRSVFGTWTSLGHPSITEIFATAGVDFVGIDLEHSTIDYAAAQGIIAAAQAGGAACLPRVASHNGEQIKRLLDAGADGVIVPMVSKPEEVERIVEWSKYPPIGKRSYGVARAQAYGFEFDAYTSAWNERSVIIIQLESVEGIEATEKLLAYDAVDGAMVGPYDLSGSLGIPGQLSDPRVREACAHVIDVCRRRGKACGTHLVEPTAAAVAASFAAGYSFVVLASDVFVLWKWSEQMRRLVRGHRDDRSR